MSVPNRYNGGGPLSGVVLVDATTGDPYVAGGGSGSTVVTQPTASLLNAEVEGQGPSGATAVGNPVGVGGVFVTTLPTLTNSQRGDLMLTAKGELLTTLSNGAGTALSSRGNGVDALANTGFTSLLTTDWNMVFNGTSWDRARGDVNGNWVNPGVMPTGTNRSGTATTTSGGLSVAANTARRTLVGQNISAVNIGVNEFGGTAAIGTAGTYTVIPGASFSISTQNLVNFIAASGTAAVTMTET